MKSINLTLFFGFFVMVLFQHSPLRAQCTGGANAGSISPTTTFQTIPCARAGEYYTFAATAGATYTFSFCQGGGNGNGIDTYLTILDNGGAAIPGAFNDNACFPVYSEVVWVATATATFRIRISLPPVGCGANATCLTLAYRMTNPPGPGVNCGNPMIIAALPYSNTGLTTCGNGNTYTSAHACGSTYMNGEDFIFRYTSPGNECINLSLTGTSNWVGVFVYNGCPNTIGTTCVAQATSGAGNPSLSNVQLVAAGTYYFLVSTLPPPNCTPFNISISRCPTGTTCSYSRVIPSLPYSQTALTTCGFGNDYNSTHACTDAYMNGEDFIFSYTITSPKCIDIFTTGTTSWAGLFVMNGCPSTVGTACIAKNVSIFGNPTLTGVQLTTPGTYYIMVDTKPLPNCTPFNILVDTCQPAVPCGSNPPADNGCLGATNISNYTSFCGNTDTVQFTPDGPGNLPGTFCGTIENNSWWSFVADTTVVHFFFTVSNCYFGNGIQAQVFSTTNCTSFTAVSNCFNPGTATNGTITATGLVPGQTYYLMVDGYAEDDCDYTVSWDGGPLPVEFGSINALLVDGKVHVNWETQSESNCMGFFIERGTPDNSREINGFQWQEAGFVESPFGTTSLPQSYFFIDNDAPTGDAYYRIREIDYDGYSSYSEVLRVVDGVAAGNDLLEIYPNPARDRIFLSLAFAQPGLANFSLIDVSGKVIFAQQLGEFQMGTYSRQVALPNLPMGIYIYDVTMGNERFRGKLMVQQ
ncbi:MAG: T9SS type A sorting domain-containing protein [Bacteroidia bacterium]|nr:T9SS type A sorting domain-containing protein [Bacteroidia bacterium]